MAIQVEIIMQEWIETAQELGREIPQLKIRSGDRTTFRCRVGGEWWRQLYRPPQKKSDRY